jgi:hypothetical protein
VWGCGCWRALAVSSWPHHRHRLSQRHCLHPVNQSEAKCTVRTATKQAITSYSSSTSLLTCAPSAAPAARIASMSLDCAHSESCLKVFRKSSNAAVKPFTSEYASGNSNEFYQGMRTYLVHQASIFERCCSGTPWPSRNPGAFCAIAGQHVASRDRHLVGRRWALCLDLKRP